MGNRIKELCFNRVEFYYKCNKEKNCHQTKIVALCSFLEAPFLAYQKNVQIIFSNNLYYQYVRQVTVCELSFCNILVFSCNSVVNKNFLLLLFYASLITDHIILDISYTKKAVYCDHKTFLTACTKL